MRKIITYAPYCLTTFFPIEIFLRICYAYHNKHALSDIYRTKGSSMELKRGPGQGHVTIKMIADEVGVSFATVSKALNNSDLVKSETKRIILSKAKEMGYTPNMLAQGLRGKPTKMAAIIINDTVNTVISYLISGISRKMNEYGYTLLTADPQFDKKNERTIIRSILEKQPDFIFYSPASLSRENFALFGELQDRLLVFGKDDDTGGISCNTIFVDYEAGGYQSAKTLINYGHKDMLVLAEPLDFPQSTLFVEGIRRAYAEHGLVLEDRRILSVCTTVESGNQVISELWDSAAGAFTLPFTGVLAFCDIVAHGVYRALRAIGKRIPEDVSVIGFDDNPLNEFSNPPLTSIKLPSEKVVECCNTIIRAKLFEKKPDIYHFSIMPYIILRNSVGPRAES